MKYESFQKQLNKKSQNFIIYFNRSVHVHGNSVFSVYVIKIHICNSPWYPGLHMHLKLSPARSTHVPLLLQGLRAGAAGQFSELSPQ